jgi:hypothetical protein
MPAALAAAVYADTDELILDPAMQHPVVRIPLDTPPLVDGRLLKGEWVRYAQLQDLVVSTEPYDDNGFAAPEPTTVFVSYSDAGLHVGFRVHMPPDVPPRTNVTGGHDAGFDDDAFEFVLVPDETAGRVYHLGGTAAGVTWDRVVTDKPDWTWNPKLRYAATIDTGNNWWMGEWFIPWDELGVEPPKPGDRWRVNFIANRRSPRFRLDTWSYWKKWWDLANNGYLVFGGDSPVFMMLEPTAQAFAGSGAWPAVGAPHRTAEDPARIAYQYQLFVRADSGHSFNKALGIRRDEATGPSTRPASGALPGRRRSACRSARCG